MAGFSYITYILAPFNLSATDFIIIVNNIIIIILLKLRTVKYNCFNNCGLYDMIWIFWSLFFCDENEH